MARSQTAAVLVALLACASLCAARSTADNRRLLGESTWLDVKIVNHCSEPVVFKAGYTFFKGQDEGHPCPNEGKGLEKDLSVCSSDWVTIDANSSTTVTDLPDMMWWYSAFVADSEPLDFLTKKQSEAWLGGDEDFNKECTHPNNETCVWWATAVTKKGGKRLVLTCPELDAAPPAENITPVELVNNCSVPVDVKVAYTMTEDGDTSGCAIELWRDPQTHLCVTDWLTLEAGEKLNVAETSDTFWSYGAHIANDPSQDLAEQVVGSFQGINDTTACPKADAYGSGYVCEWWAPTYDILPKNFDPSVPVSITCDDYTPPK